MNASLISRVTAWFESRARNEKILVLVGGAAVLYWLVSNVVLTPLDKKRNTLSEHIEQQQTKIGLLKAQLTNMTEEDVERIKTEERQRVMALQTMLKEETAALNAFRQGLVGSGQMASVLAHMLNLHSGIALESLENLPVIKLGTGPDATQPESLESDADAGNRITPALADGSDEIHLFRHTLRITLRGKYLDIVRYLSTVEKLPWRIFWDEVTLDAQQYPLSVVTLEFHTISTDEAWIKA